jgi:DNA-binding transcriptional LysR family regulator
MTAQHPATRVHIRHRSTADQVTDLLAGTLDLGLIRERPNGPELDVTLLLEEPLGVLLAANHAARLADDSGGVRLDAFAGLDWLGFPRAGSPAWYDQITATLRSHGHDVNPADTHTQDLIPEVKVAAVTAGSVFALAPPDWHPDIPDTIRWLPLIGSPLIRRTWAAWPATARRRDLAHLISALTDTDT